MAQFKITATVVTAWEGESLEAAQAFAQEAFGCVAGVTNLQVEISEAIPPETPETPASEAQAA